MRIRRIIFVLIMVFGTVGCDQAAKLMARGNLRGASPISFFNNVLRLEYAENPGAFLSFGAKLPANMRFLIFTLLTSTFLIYLAYHLIWKNNNRMTTLGLSLLLGGGLGNLIDRLIRGQVIDFLNLGIGDLRTGIFNVADMAIVAAVVILVFEPWMSKSMQIEAQSEGSK